MNTMLHEFSLAVDQYFQMNESLFYQFRSKMKWKIRLRDIVGLFGGHRGNLLLDFSVDVTDSVGGETVSARSRTLLFADALDVGFSVSDCSLDRHFPSSLVVWVRRGDGSKLTKDEIKFGSFKIVPSVSGVAGSPPGVRFHGVSGDNRLLWRVPLSLKRMDLAEVKGESLRLNVEFSTIDSVSRSRVVEIPLRERRGEEERRLLHLETSSKRLKVR